MILQQNLQNTSPTFDSNQHSMSEFKEHMKLSCKIIIDDIYDNFWSYMNKYSNSLQSNKKQQLQDYINRKYEKGDKLVKKEGESGAKKVQIFDEL